MTEGDLRTPDGRVPHVYDTGGTGPRCPLRLLARRCPAAELRVSPDDGHLWILDAADAALEWLVAVGRR